MKSNDYSKEINQLIESNQNLDDFCYDALFSISQSMNVQRVSLWFLSESRQAIQCKTMLDKNLGAIIEHSELSEMDFPEYFKALKKESIIVADDAQRDPRTSEFTDMYLIPHNISSMLDAPIFNNGKLTGIICCEHCGEKREWLQEEQYFVSDVASLIGELME